MRRTKGFEFEQVAEKYLVTHGMRTVCRNYSCRLGEIDLVMLDGATLVFVEVRFRESTAFGGPLDSITPRKQSRVIRTATNFLQRSPKFHHHPCRFDAVGITGSQQPPDICWIKGAFSA